VGARDLEKKRSSIDFSEAHASDPPYVLNDRRGLLLPIGASLAVTAATILALFMVPQSGASFLVTSALLQIAWVFLNCYLYSALICAPTGWIWLTFQERDLRIGIGALNLYGSFSRNWSTGILRTRIYTAQAAAE
jgi:hypothetical protein